MIIGVPKEIKTREYRVGMTPAGVRSLTSHGHKVLVETGTGRILGAHLVGPDADELINIFGLAIRHGLNADDIKSTMFAYPTAASDAGSMLG